MLAALFGCSLAYNAPLARPAVTRAVAPAMKIYPEINSAAINFDQEGQFAARQSSSTKPPTKILTRIEELRVLSNLADAGLLSAAEEAGVFTKLENAGAFSKVEKLLPLADDLKLLSTAEKLLNVDSSVLLIALVPDDSAALVALQVATGVAAGAASVTLIAV